MKHDVLLCIDSRFPGGTSTALIQELGVLSSRMEPDQVGVLVLESTLFNADRAANRDLTEALRRCPFPVYRFDSATSVFSSVKETAKQPYSRGVRTTTLHARYLVVHNPYVAPAAAALADRLSADHALVVCHQPYVDNEGVPYYSAADIASGLSRLAAVVQFVPIGHLSRQGFVAHGWEPHLARFDWPNVFDFEGGPAATPSTSPERRSGAFDQLVIGRHSRPDWVKWPSSKEEFGLIYQHGTRRLVRFLGWGAHCDELFAGDIPRNWDTLGYNETDVDTFLRNLDVFVYYHHPNWVEGFGRSVPEAIAAGRPCILSPVMAPTFRGLAFYPEPHQVGSLLDRFDSLRDELHRWSLHSREAAAKAFGPQALADVYEALAGAVNEHGLDRSAHRDAEMRIAEAQHRKAEELDRCVELQMELGLEKAAVGRPSLVPGILTPPARQPTAAIPATDFAIYMDFRSARSDAWRSLELALALSQSGYEVSIVHVETRGKTDFAGLNPLIAELPSTIRLYGGPGGGLTRHLEIRKGLIIAAPHLMFDEAGRPHFGQFVQPVASQVLVFLDRKTPRGWMEAASQSIGLMCGCVPKWVLLGLDAKDFSTQRLDVAEAPDLQTFVADRSVTAKRDLTKHICGRQQLRRGRIGLMDPTQWALDADGSAVEGFGSIPFLAYTTPNARSAPGKLLESEYFHEFRAGEISLSRFLEKIDLLTYFPSDAPSDTLIIPILRAVQAGVLVLADRALRDRLGPFVLYCDRHEVEQTVVRLAARQDHTVRTALSNARGLALARYQDRAVGTLESLSGLEVGARSEGLVAKFPVQSPRPEILFLSSNGVGLGHLTRLMAIARRLQRADPVFVTMSQAFVVVQAAGWPVKYLPFHTVSGCNVAKWNEWLKYELEMLLHSRPNIRTLVFDGSNPYSGLLAACGGSDLRKVWVQRGMWKKGQMSLEHVRRGKNFDLIIEPADLAEALATEEVESMVFDKVRTDPILLLDRNELLGREEARASLGISEDRRVCLIQLGSGTNRDIVSLLNVIIPHLLERGVTPYIAEWLMGSEIPRIWPDAVYLRVFPLSKYFDAFDFSIAAAGYNSFHEIISFGLPTIFIANEHQMMDDQAGRASHALTNDSAFWIVEEAVQEIGTAVDLIMRDEVRDLIKSNCLAMVRRNGAQDAASMIEKLTLEAGNPVALGSPPSAVPLERWAI